jgi:hypothetical protein
LHYIFRLTKSFNINILNAGSASHLHFAKYQLSKLATMKGRIEDATRRLFFLEVPIHLREGLHAVMDDLLGGIDLIEELNYTLNMFFWPKATHSSVMKFITQDHNEMLTGERKKHWEAIVKQEEDRKEEYRKNNTTITTSKQGGRKFEGKCYICNKENHMARECRFRNQNNGNGGTGGASFRGPGRTGSERSGSENNAK